ncbi:MAG: helix-turn-helix transcriptional regulator [Methylococcales bacterium]
MNPIAEYLEKEDRSQAWFGKQIGVSQGMVQHWINDRRPINIETALTIENTFCIEAESLNPGLKPLFEQLEKRALKKMKEKKASVKKI